MGPPTNSEKRCVSEALADLVTEILEKNTNVIELYNLILKESKDKQKTWYNSGIGTYARPSWKSLKFYKKVLYHKIDLAIAWFASSVSTSYSHLSLLRDFERTVLGAYRWLSDNYEPGDCIFLFGALDRHVNFISMS